MSFGVFGILLKWEADRIIPGSINFQPLLQKGGFMENSLLLRQVSLNELPLASEISYFELSASSCGVPLTLWV